MSKKARVTVLLVIALGLCLDLVAPATEAEEQKPRVYVDPEYNRFYKSITSLGSTFSISVKTASWAPPGVFSYQLRLFYNNTLLEPIAAWFPPDCWIKPLPLIDGPLYPEINHQQGFIDTAVTLLSPEAGRTGGGTLFATTFKITQAPAVGERLSCLLELTGVIMVDPDANEIPAVQYIVSNGEYLFSAREDLNLDGRVNILDVAIWAVAFRAKPGDAKWNSKADLNGDQEIDIIDMTYIAKAWTW